jgi:hypothetical protein
VKYHTRQQIEVPAILILNCTMACKDSARVWRMAQPGTGGWSIMNGPFPSRLVSGAPKRHAGNVDDFKPSEGEFANLIRPFERFQQSLRHRLLFPNWSPPTGHFRIGGNSIIRAKFPKCGWQTGIVGSAQ